MAAKQILYRQRYEKYRYFEPNGKQNEFLQLDSFIRIFSAGNGVGKSALMVNVIANLTAPINHTNKWFKGMGNIRRPNRGRIVSTSTNIQQNIVPELKKWLPQGRFTAEKRGIRDDDFLGLALLLRRAPQKHNRVGLLCYRG